MFDGIEASRNGSWKVGVGSIKVRLVVSLSFWLYMCNMNVTKEAIDAECNSEYSTGRREDDAIIRSTNECGANVKRTERFVRYREKSF